MATGVAVIFETSQKYGFQTLDLTVLAVITVMAIIRFNLFNRFNLNIQSTQSERDIVLLRNFDVGFNIKMFHTER